jgi:hypothetical protein
MSEERMPAPLGGTAAFQKAVRKPDCLLVRSSSLATLAPPLRLFPLAMYRSQTAGAFA